MTTVGETLTRRNFGHHTQYEQLLDLLTVERMGSYFDAARGDTESAFSLYEWNMEASAAIMSTTGMVELLVRNALDRRLSGSRIGSILVTGSISACWTSMPSKT